jgi:murein DD-endopeptidase MepM/ murein hydrolase activator NlpD
MSKRYIDFLIVPEGKSRSFKFKLSYFTTWILLGVGAILLVFMVGLSILHGQLIYQVLAGKSLKQENEKLKRYNARVAELERELKEYESFVQRVADLAGVEFKGKMTSQLAYYPEKTVPKDTGVIPQAKAKEEKMVSFQETDLLIPATDLIGARSDSMMHIPMGAPIAGWATKGFSMNTPKLGGAHPGVDFAAKIGTKVKATADGKVILAGWDDTYGNLVGIDHGNGYVTYYGHNLKNLVNVGYTVHRGDVIALSGSSGRSSAPHLHYEIKKDGISIDPKDFLK